MNVIHPHEESARCIGRVKFTTGTKGRTDVKEWLQHVMLLVYVVWQNKWQHLIKKSLTIPKGFIRIGISKMDRQHKGQKKKNKRTKNYLQNITQKTKDRATRTYLKTKGELWCSGRVSISRSTNGTRRVTLVIKRYSSITHDKVKSYQLKEESWHQKSFYKPEFYGGHIIQWSNEKRHKYKPRSTKNTT